MAIRGVEEASKKINSHIGEFHTIVVGKWKSHWRWNTGGQFIGAVSKVIAVEKR